jgi:hypothetical protein
LVIFTAVKVNTIYIYSRKKQNFTAVKVGRKAVKVEQGAVKSLKAIKKHKFTDLLPLPTLQHFYRLLLAL